MDNVENKPFLYKNKSIIHEYVYQLENKIIQNPGDWLWSHKRWKLTK